MDDGFIERLRRSVKYEKLRLWSDRDIPELRWHVDEWMNFYNHERKHQILIMRRPGRSTDRRRRSRKRPDNQQA